MKFIKLELPETDEDMCTINENSLTHVKRAIYGDTKSQIKTFGILSVDNPMGEIFTLQNNNKARQSLKATLKAAHYQYTNIKGKYVDIEQSFFIFNISLKSLISLATTFKQESFIFGQQIDNKAQIYYYETDKEKYMASKNIKDIKYTSSTISQGTNLMDLEMDMFSQKNAFKYSFNFDFSNMEFVPSQNQKALEESLDDSYCGKHQFVARIRSQK